MDKNKLESGFSKVMSGLNSVSTKVGQCFRQLCEASPKTTQTASKVVVAVAVLVSLVALKKGDYPVIGAMVYLAIVAADSYKYASRALDQKSAESKGSKKL